MKTHTKNIFPLVAEGWTGMAAGGNRRRGQLPGSYLEPHPQYHSEGPARDHHWPFFVMMDGNMIFRLLGGLGARYLFFHLGLSYFSHVASWASQPTSPWPPRTQQSSSPPRPPFWPGNSSQWQPSGFTNLFSPVVFSEACL